jgi:hypothetical protein
MNGAETVSPGGTNVASGDNIPVALGSESSDSRSVRRRRRNRRHRTLGDKLKRHQATNRMRRIVAILIMGAVIIGASMYMAQQANEYVPVPTYPEP